MTHPYRMLLLDLDGTTLHGHGQLDERNIAAALALKELGVAVTICTGRLFTGTQWVAKKLGVEGCVGVVNGRERIDANTGVVAHGSYIDRESRMQAREMLLESGLTAFLFGSRTIHYGRDAERHTNYLGIWTTDLQPHDDIMKAPAWERDDIVSLCAVGPHAKINDLRDRFERDLPKGLGTFRFNTFEEECFVELGDHRDNKGTALEGLAAERGFTAAQTVAVGDWLNDLPMFDKAGLSFCMGHALDHVKAAADEVLSSDRHTGGGVAEVAKRVWGVDV